MVWSDFDNDGWLDLLVANRTGRPFVLRNLADGTFVRATGVGITAQNEPSNGVAVGDYNGDGYQDVALANWPGGSTVLYANLGGTNHWLRVRLEGKWSTRSGLGARVRATATLGGRRMTLLRQIGGEDGWGTQEILAHFGLGDATQVETLSIEWPSGAVSTLRQVGVDQTLTVSEQATADLLVEPRSGVFAAPFQLTFRSGIAAGEIHYTTDGSDPSISSPRYTDPFTVATTTTVKARLFVGGVAGSAAREFLYRIDSGLRIEPTFGFFTNAVRVTLVSSLPDAVIRFTLNGEDPTESSLSYREPFRLSETTEVRVRSFVGSSPASGIVKTVFRRLYVAVEDGIPADWRRRYFGEEFAFDPRAMASADPDFDGTTNLQEFLVGTDPLDPKSGILAGIRMLAEIRFETVVGVKYRILRSNAVTGVRVVVAEGIVGTGEVMTWVDSESPPANSFYVIDPVP